MTKPGIEPGSVCFLHGRATDWPTKVWCKIKEKYKSIYHTKSVQWRKNRYSEEKNRYFFLLLFIPNFSWQFIATFFLSFFLHFPWLFYHFLQWVLWLYTQKYPENWKKQSVHFFSLFLECSKFFLLFVTCFTFTRK